MSYFRSVSTCLSGSASKDRWWGSWFDRVVNRSKSLDNDSSSSRGWFSSFWHVKD